MRVAATLREAWTRMEEGFLSLRGSPRDLYIIYWTKALTSYTYFSLSLIYVIYLSDEFGIGDIEAGSSYGIWGMLVVIWGILLGPVIDMLGVRSSILVCFVLSFLARMGLAMTSSRSFMYFLLYVLVPVSDSMGVPVMTIGVKRFTNADNRPFAFGLFYSIMNVAALANGFIMDFLRVYLCNGLNIKSLEPGHWLNSGNRLIMLTGAIVSLIGIVMALLLQKEQVKLSGPGDADVSPVSAQVATPAHSVRHWSARCRQNVTRQWDGISQLAGSKALWKYIVLALFLTNLRQVFRFLDAMLPKYMIRQFGCDAPVGSIYSINPAMIIVMVPIVAAMTQHIPHFDVIHYGGYISALSPFWIVARPTESGAALFVVMLSLGEAFWSPRWYDLTMDVAPDGQEGVFGAVSSMPLFLAKAPAGFLSGALLASYCAAPPDGSDTCRGGSPRCLAHAPPPALLPPPPPPLPPPLSAPAGAVQCHGRTLWLIVGCLTLSSPLLVSIFQRWLRPDPAAASHGLGASSSVNRGAPRRKVRGALESVPEEDYEGSSRSCNASQRDLECEPLNACESSSRS